MPKSKRNQQISLQKTRKKTKTDKQQLIQKIQNCFEFKYLIVFEIENSRNQFVTRIRVELGKSKMMFGSNRVMAKAIGTSESDEHVKNGHLVSELLENNVGLLFTNQSPAEIQEYFSSLMNFKDYARMGQLATQDFTISQGPLVRDNVNFPSNMEPLFRKLGLNTELQKGVIHLREPYCITKGTKLGQENCLILV